MKYVCLVYGESHMFNELSPARLAKLDADSLAYDSSLAAEGRLIMAEALQSVTTSKTVRKRNRKVVVTDGPFAETKEQLLGFVIVEAANLDQALTIAAGIPLAELGSVEVRAIYTIPGS